MVRGSQYEPRTAEGNSIEDQIAMLGCFLLSGSDVRHFVSEELTRTEMAPQFLSQARWVFLL